MENCFVLRPDKDHAAKIALEAYAKETDKKELADDIFRWVGDSGKVMVLPCKVGDTVWMLNHHYRAVGGIVESIHQNYVAGCAGRWVVTVYFPEFYGSLESGIDPDFAAAKKYLHFDDFGKTIFLTREAAEAAEAALKEGGGATMKRDTYYRGVPGVKYGIWNAQRKCWQFGICEDTPMLAEARLFQKIGDDAHKWRFEARPLPKKTVERGSNHEKMCHSFGR